MPPIFTIEKREEIKTNLLQIGIELIREIGIKKMSIDKVTERAGIGKGTFYHFFDTKERYVFDVIQFSKERILKSINAIVEKKGGIDKESFLELFQTFSFSSENNIISYI
jgi:AcrR family transcriptional regulator